MSNKFDDDMLLDGEFCWCGLPAKRKINNQYYCQKHKCPKSEIRKIGKYSGKSKSEYAFGMY